MALPGLKLRKSDVVLAVLTLLTLLAIAIAIQLTPLVYHRVYDDPPIVSTRTQLETWRLVQGSIIAGWLTSVIAAIVCGWSAFRVALRYPGVPEWLWGYPLPPDCGIRPLRFWLCLATVIISGAASFYCMEFVLGPNDIPGTAAKKICFREDQADAAPCVVFGWPTTAIAIWGLRRSYSERTC